MIYMTFYLENGLLFGITFEWLVRFGFTRFTKFYINLPKFTSCGVFPQCMIKKDEVN